MAKMPSPSPRIRSASVLGAGTMGAQIAAHLSNAGYPVSLLDVSAQAARDGLERARKLKPDPFFAPDSAGRIRTGGFDSDLEWIAQADWIIEAVIEQADAKRTLLERVDTLRRPGSIVSSNTSGLSIAGLAEGRSADFRRHWLGTHFFNPPRYLPLLEIIPTADTDPAVVAAVREFADRRLGKNVVIAKDTPGFIANHVAMHGLVRIFEALADGAFTVEEIDAITGAAIGRPKSATFRTVDIAGLDILVHVANDLAARLPGGRGAQFQFPPFVQEMLKRGWIGEKAGRGFYERRKNTDGGNRYLGARSARDGISAAASGRAPVSRCRCATAAARAHAQAVFGQRPRRRVSPVNASRFAALRRGDRTRDRAFDRRHRSRDAMGLWMAARPVRVGRCDRPERAPLS